jgi:hypothetical protein
MNGAESLQHWERKLYQKLPEGTAPLIAKWIVELRVSFKISRPRDSKLGDFRASLNGKAHQITVNSNLNPYAFLITTVHEFAHLGCFLKYKNRVAPHGPEWKSIYVSMLRRFQHQNIFPPDLEAALERHIRKPKASSCSCPDLSRALARYDHQPGTLLFDLSSDHSFVFRSEDYRLIEKRRTRALCERLSDGKRYLISGRAIVIPHEKP